MPHTRETWAKHPGRNPAHRFGEGRPRMETMWGMMLGPKNPSRWLPHQGKRETARRRQTQP